LLGDARSLPSAEHLHTRGRGERSLRYAATTLSTVNAGEKEPPPELHTDPLGKELATTREARGAGGLLKLTSLYTRGYLTEP